MESTKLDKTHLRNYMRRRAYCAMQRVYSALSGSLEINTVFYDPAKVTVEEMEKALKQAKTYRQTVRAKQ